MPVFNGERFLAEALTSILEQTLTDLELIVVDDGSADGSRGIAESLASGDSRLRVIAVESNEGLARAINRGWHATEAEYVARLNADDVALPERLARQVAFLDANPSIAAVGGAAILIDSAGRATSLTRYPTDSQLVRSTLPRHNCLAHSAEPGRSVLMGLVPSFPLGIGFSRQSGHGLSC